MCRTEVRTTWTNKALARSCWILRWAEARDWEHSPLWLSRDNPISLLRSLVCWNYELCSFALHDLPSPDTCCGLGRQLSRRLQFSTLAGETATLGPLLQFVIYDLYQLSHKDMPSHQMTAVSNFNPEQRSHEAKRAVRLATATDKDETCDEQRGQTKRATWVSERRETMMGVRL